MALHVDGFNQNNSLMDLRSVGGYFLMPLGLPANVRKSAASARLVTITSHGQKLNDSLKNVMDDILNAAVQGFLVTDPGCRHVLMFTYPFAFFVDYPAVSDTSDSMGHSADELCTHYGFRKMKRVGNPKVLYTTDIHSRRLVFMRFDQRMTKIWKSSPHSEVLGMLEIKCNSQEEFFRLPGLRLGKTLEERSKEAGIDIDTHVVVPLYDASLSAAAALDHLLTGIFNNVLKMCFQKLKSDRRRRKTEMIILITTTINVILVQNFLRWENNTGNFKGLLNM